MVQAPNKSRRWTDTDDAVVLAFPPTEAAAILGRTLAAIYSRRSLKDLGGANTDRKPRKRLRRDYFRDGQGERAEAIPQRQPPKCRFCPRVARGRGLCTSHVERNNLTIRTFMKRFCRLTMGFSRKIENLEAAVNLHVAYFNFCWRPGEMRVTPAQAAGIADHCWTFDELLAESVS